MAGIRRRIAATATASRSPCGKHQSRRRRRPAPGVERPAADFAPRGVTASFMGGEVEAARSHRPPHFELADGATSSRLWPRAAGLPQERIRSRCTTAGAELAFIVSEAAKYGLRWRLTPTVRPQSMPALPRESDHGARCSTREVSMPMARFWRGSPSER